LEILRAEKLRRTFHTGDGILTVLSDVELSVEQGSVVSVVGASGSGKSTLLQLLGGLDRPDSGRVLVNGEDIHALSEQERAGFRSDGIGFVFQFHHLLPDFTALENVLIAGLIAGSKRRIAETRASELLSQVGLLERATHRPSELSGGEQQRVAVARALMNRPRLILADEPSGNLDAQNAVVLEELLWSLTKERDASLVLVTHDEKLARKADRCVRLKNGRLTEVSYE
jgi:lipoprotein-releasing system ATP-binding protein